MHFVEEAEGDLLSQNQTPKKGCDFSNVFFSCWQPKYGKQPFPASLLRAWGLWGVCMKARQGASLVQ